MVRRQGEDVERAHKTNGVVAISHDQEPIAQPQPFVMGPNLGFQRT